MARKTAEKQTTGLDLRINGVVYAVSIVPPDRIEDDDVSRCLLLTKRARDGAKTGARYECSETVWGNVCTCPDFEFRKAGLDEAGCKHLKALAVWGLVSEPAVSRQSPPRDWPTWADAQWTLTPAGMTAGEADSAIEDATSDDSSPF